MIHTVLKHMPTKFLQVFKFNRYDVGDYVLVNKGVDFLPAVVSGKLRLIFFPQGFCCCSVLYVLAYINIFNAVLLF